MSADEAPLSERQLSYRPVGATDCAEPVWSAAPPGFRRLETTVLLGSGAECWADAADQVLRWTVKTRSGFRVDGPPGPVETRDRRWVSARMGPLVIREPVEVVAVTRRADRVGFAYGTLTGHPVSGEEAFVVHRDADGQVWLTLRSLTRAAPQLPWRPLFPMLLVAQRGYRRRYQRALRCPAATPAGPFTRQVDVAMPGGPVRVHSIGDAEHPPVLLLHGAMLDNAVLAWRQLAPELARAGYCVHAVDLPRHGGSRPWSGVVDQGTLEEVVDQVLDELGVVRTAVVGHSLGAGVALGYLLRRPDRITGAVLIAPGGLESRRPAQFLTWLALQLPGLLRATTWYLAIAPRAVRAALASSLETGSNTPGFDATVALAEQEARHKRRHHEPALDDWQRIAYGPLAMRFNLLPDLGRVARPTLWLRGNHDPLVRQSTLDAAVAATPDARSTVITDAGHLVPLDQPAVLAGHVLRYLDSLHHS